MFGNEQKQSGKHNQQAGRDIIQYIIQLNGSSHSIDKETFLKAIDISNQNNSSSENNSNYSIDSNIISEFNLYKLEKILSSNISIPIHKSIFYYAFEGENNSRIDENIFDNYILIRVINEIRKNRKRPKVRPFTISNKDDIINELKNIFQLLNKTLNNNKEEDIIIVIKNKNFPMPSVKKAMDSLVEKLLTYENTLLNRKQLLFILFVNLDSNGYGDFKYCEKILIEEYFDKENLNSWIDNNIKHHIINLEELMEDIKNAKYLMSSSFSTIKYHLELSFNSC